MYRIEEPYYFYLLTIIPIILVAFIIYLWWKKRVQHNFGNKELFKKLAPNISTSKSILKIIVISLSLLFFIISLANPKMGTKIKTIKRKGVSIVFALDVSKSMLSEDIAPNRLDKAKQIISKIVNNLVSDRVGVIIYAGSAYPLLPITTDLAAAKMFLQNATPNMVSSQGTAINEAVKLATTYFNYTDKTNKYIIILSDGEDHQDENNEIVEQAAKKGIKILTIGIGTAKGGPIPIKNNGILLGYKKDNKQQVVITKRHEDILKRIAKEGNGIYINGNITEKPVEEINKKISNAQKHEFETKQFSDYKSQFQWFIAIGLLFLIIDILLLNKKTQWLKKIDLFNEEK